MAAQILTVKPPKTPHQLAMKFLAGKPAWGAVFFSMVISLVGVARGGRSGRWSLPAAHALHYLPWF
jgi:hypothetical protein